MATNDFKPFATADGANVTSQTDWETLPALDTGFQSGKASSAQVNKALRQATFIAAALAQYTANQTEGDVLDNGDLDGFVAQLASALAGNWQPDDATLTALAGLATSADQVPYFTGVDAAAVTALTGVGRSLIGQGSVDAVRQYLGLGDAATHAASDFLPVNGNAATATKLQTARTIGGVSFDGTANINLPGVNQAGNQSTSGNAATATKLQTARTINGVAFDGTQNITLPGPDLSAYLTTSTANSTYQKINTVSKAANGWFKDSNTGLIIQWGYTSNAGAGVTFPIVFPSACQSVTITNAHNRCDYSISLNSISNTSATFYNENSGNMYWTAMGY